MLRCIDPTTSKRPIAVYEEEVVDLRRNAVTVLVSDEDVAQGLRRLQTLVISHPNPGLTKRLLHPIVLPLWALASWPSPSEKCQEDVCQPASNLLKIYLKISVSPDKLMPIVRNLLFDGFRSPEKPPPWQYQAKGETSGGICIVSAADSPADAAEILQTRWNEIGPKADALLDLLASISTDDDDVSAIFMDLFGRWLSSSSLQHRVSEVAVLVKEESELDSGSDNDPLRKVLEGSLLQKMMERFPERLAGRPEFIMELVGGLLRQLDDATLASDETVPLLLSLLNLVVTSPGFRRAKADAKIVEAIEGSLDRISWVSGSDAAEDTAKTAKNLLLFIRYRDEIEGPEDTGTPSNAETASRQRNKEDRKTYNLAMSYITQADSPPPVRSEGLNLLQGLIQAKSPILDIAAILVLMSSLLDENEDYINLRIIKIFTLLADAHPKSTTKELLDHYVDATETKSVDARLRVGEALLQVVQRLGATFAGDTARQVGQALLETAGRRGYRPKTAAKHAREERMRDLKSKSKKGALDGDQEREDSDEDVDMEDALLTEDERARNEILGRIVEGWSSTGGKEDVRVRASALSVLAAAMDVNIGGLGATLASGAVDLSLHVLTLEPEPEKGILRRAAIVVILSFVRALHDAREAGRRLGFGLAQQSQDDILRILRYVGETDEDGLVRQHAADVVESLENWQMASLLPAGGGEELTGPLGGLNKLAGLSIGAASPGGVASGQRPRIEEIE